MARPFSSIDAKRIIERHQNITEKLNEKSNPPAMLGRIE